MNQRETVRETAVAIVHGWTPAALDFKFEVEEVLRRHEGLEGRAMHLEALRVLARRGVYPIHFAISENSLVTNGQNAMLLALIGSAIPNGGYYSNANANLGVGDSSTAFAVGQTDLQAATNIKLKAMDATFPSVSGNVVTFRATFATTDANFSWNEWGIFNGATHGTNNLLNRAVPGGGLGTKTSAASWQFTVTITLT